MKTTKPSWNMKKLQRMLTTNSLSFDYPIQRASGQWDALQQSLLIHSVLADMPIPPIAIAKADVDGNESEYVIDGKQRTTTVLNFMSGIKDKETGRYPDTAYKLHKDTPSVNIEGIDETLDIANKYYDELHEELQSELQSSTFMIQRMEDATDEQIEEIFNRWNNGTPLTKQQKARGKMGTNNATIISHLMGHPFIQETSQFTPLQRKRSDDEAVILQSIMLLDKENLQSFVSDKILEFASDMREADITEKTNTILSVMDYLSKTASPSPLFKKLHLPMLLHVAQEAKEKGIDSTVFDAWVADFNTSINLRTYKKALVETDYRNFTGAGSVKREKVLGRLDSMLKHFNTFLEVYEAPEMTEEEKKELVENELSAELSKETPEASQEEQTQEEVATTDTVDETSVTVATEEQEEQTVTTEEPTSEDAEEQEEDGKNALDIIAEMEQSDSSVNTPSDNESSEEEAQSTEELQESSKN